MLGRKRGLVNWVEVYGKTLSWSGNYLHLRAAALFVTSGTARALVRGTFADTALGTFGAAHGAAGAAALLAGGAFAVLAAAGAGAGAGAACGGEGRQRSVRGRITAVANTMCPAQFKVLFRTPGSLAPLLSSQGRVRLGSLISRHNGLSPLL